MSGLCLVTGGAGFIGSHLVDGLLDAGFRVRVLDDLSTGRRENLSDVADRIEFLEGDVRDATLVGRALEGCRFVFHEAALPSVIQSIEDPVESGEVNAHATLMLLQASRRAGVERLVFAGSCAVYGDDETLPLSETTPVRPLSPYALHKYASELHCRLFTELYGFETVVLRYFNVYGPRQDPRGDYAAVVPLFVEAFQKETAPTSYGDGEQTRDFVYVTDVVAANLRAATTPGAAGGVFNVASGSATSVNELFGLVRELAGVCFEARREPGRAGEVRHSRADVTGARQVLGFSGSVEIREGVRRIWRASEDGSECG